MKRRAPLFFLGTWLVATSLGAQYNPPGTSVSGENSPPEEEIRSSLDAAPWRLGVLRLQPWLGVRDASFVTSSQGGGTDFTLSAGAGLRAYVKNGPKVIWAAHALPEYVWWQEDQDKRGLNGRYGLGLFAFLHRLQLEMSARRDQTQGFFSSELQELTSTRRDVARFAFELEMVKRFFLFGSYAKAATDNREKRETVFASLDHKSETIRLGLRYRSPRGWWAGAGVEDLATDFDATARNLSNTGDARFFDLGWEGERFGALASVELRSLEPRAGSSFAALDTTTGYLETVWSLHRSAELFLYGRRQLGYSVRGENSSLLTDRLGARIGLNLRGTRLDVAAELGEDDYQSLAALPADRVDDVTAWIMALSFEWRELFVLRLGLSYTEYDSNFDQFDRDVTAWTATVQLLPSRAKLGLGDGERIW